ncbi:cation transporter [Gemmatimonas sp.]|uniref:cation transporter n=1 Tax=Gemmatimonas sp. TaxID=1962908 RepID=UPI0039832EF0
MSTSCVGEGCGAGDASTPRYRRVLWAALAINALMFGVEVVGGVATGSSALQADALDFLGDAANYGISLFVLSAALVVRAQASIAKAATMAAFGCWVIGHAFYQAATGRVPEPLVMGVIGGLALVANVLVAVLLYRYRSGDSNMRSVWICSRNDAIGNLAVVGAATGVFTTQHGWPDVTVAVIMGALSLAGAWQIVRHARRDLAPSSSAHTHA